jgi:hypothetical protein
MLYLLDEKGLEEIENPHNLPLLYPHELGSIDHELAVAELR